jgi:exopolyphosphatase/guanosine-5'-triphosphate,3'-diphosphate pyrophosphatase
MIFVLQELKMKKQLIIEIGSNTIKAIWAERLNNAWEVLSGAIYPTRLGEGVSQSGLLSLPAMERNLDAIAEIISKSDDADKPEVYIIATESLRKAENAEDFLTQVKARFQLGIEILSGDREAELSFLAATQPLKKSEQAVAVIDIGGGSTELAIGKAGTAAWQKSLPIGAVRMTEQFIRHDPPATSEIKAMQTQIRSSISEYQTATKIEQLIGVGGTVTTLARLSGYGLSSTSGDIPELNGMTLPGTEILRLKNLFSIMTLTQKEAIPRMPKGRADIILAGACILLTAMDYLKVQEITVSTGGVRHGYLYSLV